METRGSSHGDEAIPASTVSMATTNAVGPMAPNGAVNRLAIWATPSTGRAKVKADASTTGSPCDASLCISARSNGPLVSCGSGKLVTITATIVTGTISASTAAMDPALPDQVSERMPPSTTVVMKAPTSRMIISACDSPASQPAAKAPMRSSAAIINSAGGASRHADSSRTVLLSKRRPR